MLNKTLIALHMESILLLFQDYWNNNVGGQSATTARKLKRNCDYREEMRLCWHRAEWERKDKTLLERKKAD